MLTVLFLSVSFVSLFTSLLSLNLSLFASHSLLFFSLSPYLFFYEATASQLFQTSHLDPGNFRSSRISPDINNSETLWRRMRLNFPHRSNTQSSLRANLAIRVVKVRCQARGRCSEEGRGGSVRM